MMFDRLASRAIRKAALVLGSAMLVIATAASGQAQSEPEWTWAEAGRPYVGTTIHVRIPTHPSTRSTAPLIREFEEATGINVEFSNELVSRDLTAVQDIELATGAVFYDVMFIGADAAARIARMGWAEPLDGFIADPNLTAPDFNIADFIEVYLEMLAPDGNLIGLPYTGESWILYYNTAIFDEHGIEGPPATLDELEAIAEIIHSDDTPAWAVRAARGQGLNIMSWAQWLWSYGGRYLDEDTGAPIVNSPEAVLATERFVDLLQRFGPSGYADLTHHDIVYSYFSQGALGMFIDASVWVGVFNDPEQSTIVGNWSTAPVPEGPAGQFPAVYSQGAMIPRGAQNPEAAWLFLQWFTSRDTQYGRALEVDGERSGDVTRWSVVSEPRFQEAYGDQNWVESTFGGVEAGRVDYRPLNLTHWVEIGDILGIAVQNVTTRTRSAQAALDDANARIARLLED